MDGQENKFKIFVLETPYEYYENCAHTRDIVSDIFKIKLKGYKPSYPFGMMPIGALDFFSNHVLLTREEVDGSFTPLMTFKSTKLSDCKKFSIPFPIIGHKFGDKKSMFKEHILAIESWLNSRDLLKEEVGYNSGWTMNNEVNNEKGLRRLIRDLSTYLYYFYYTSYNIPNIITSASSKFKVYRLQEEMGFSYLKDRSGNRLEDFASPAFFDEHFYIMHLENSGFPKEFLEKAMKFKSLWDNRTTFSEAHNSSEIYERDVA